MLLVCLGVLYFMVRVWILILIFPFSYVFCCLDFAVKVVVPDCLLIDRFFHAKSSCSLITSSFNPSYLRNQAACLITCLVLERIRSFELFEASNSSALHPWILFRGPYGGSLELNETVLMLSQHACSAGSNALMILDTACKFLHEFDVDPAFMFCCVRCAVFSSW